jgi:hypothetical protein
MRAAPVLQQGPAGQLTGNTEIRTLSGYAESDRDVAWGLCAPGNAVVRRNAEENCSEIAD